MSKKTSEVEDYCLCMDDYFPKCDGTKTHPMMLSEILSMDVVQQQLAKEKMELVERIEAKLRDAREYYADNAQYARDNVEWIKVVEALDSVLSALKSEIQEKEEVGG